MSCNDFVVRTVLDIHKVSTEERTARGYIDGNKKAKQSVEQIDLITGKVINIFSSITEAAKTIGGDTSSISKACRGKIKSHHGYGWRYQGAPAEKRNFSSRKINQIDLKTNEIIHTYDSLS